MALWGNLDQANNAPKTNGIVMNPVTGKANGSQLFNNTSPNAIINGIAVGVFGVDTTEATVKGKVNHAGWVLVKYGTGTVTGAAVANVGTAFANGETVTVSGGSANATLTVTTNATSNITSFAITNAGYGFTNTSTITSAFTREKHVLAITVTGTTSGYGNSDYIVVSNGSINAIANITTNATGGFVNSGITITNVGLFGNTLANTGTVKTIYLANGSAATGTGATLVSNLVTSTTGGVTITLGGKSGRVSYEPLVAMATINAASDSENTVFPNS